MPWLARDEIAAGPSRETGRLGNAGRVGGFEGFRREAPDVVWCGRDAGGDQTFRTSLFTVVGRDTVGGEKYMYFTGLGTGLSRYRL